MKATGIVRQVDYLGRVVIPKELRNTLSIFPDDPMEIFIEDRKIILQKYIRGCMNCNETDGLVEFGSITLCQHCISTMHSIVSSESTEESVCIKD